MKIRSRLVTATCAVLAALTFGSVLGSSPAGAINPRQTTESGVVNVLNPDLDYFWKWQFQRWGRSFGSARVSYFNVDTNVAGCGTVRTGQIGVACSPNQIWIAYNVNQAKINAYGDYAGGFILAHEYGHLVQFQLGAAYKPKSVVGRELFADCMAGAFSRWEWNRGRIDNADFYEAVNLLRSFGPASEGYPQPATRVAWFDYGFQNNNVDLCFAALAN
jgi:predicted metalloprotease